MRFATYGRKSVYSDKSDSVNNQERMCREYVQMKFEDVESFETYSDEGFTGANTNRPGLKQLMDDIEDGLVNALIVYQLDRISRNVKDFADIYATLEKKGVMFISIKENIDTATPIGKAMMYVTMVFAQMERETIAARVTDNLQGLAKKGLWMGGNPPCGYVRKQIEINGKKHVALAPDPDGMKHTSWIFSTFLESKHSLQGLVNDFRKQGIKTLSGSPFSVSLLYKILKTPYCVEATPEIYDYFAALGCQMDADSPREKWDGTHGVMVYGRTSEKTGKHAAQPPDKWNVCLGRHKPFIPADQWLAVQERFKQNTFNKTAKYDITLLKGTLRCKKCGCLMQVSRKKTKSGVTSHYFCLKRSRQGVEACDMRSIKCGILDEKVLDVFREIEDNPEIIMNYVKTDVPKSNRKNTKELEIKAARISAKIERLAESLAEAEGSAAAKYVLTQIEKEDLNLEAVKRELLIAKADDRKKRKTEKTAAEKATEISELIRGIDSFSAADRNAIVRDIVKECAWDGETLFLRL